MSFAISPDFNRLPELLCEIPTLSLAEIAMRPNLRLLYVDENVSCPPLDCNRYIIHRVTGSRTYEDNLRSATEIIQSLWTLPGDREGDYLIILDIALDDAVGVEQCRDGSCESIQCIMNLVAHLAGDLLPQLHIRPVGQLGHPEVCPVQMARIREVAVTH